MFLVVFRQERPSGSRYFAKVCFGHPSPSKQQKLNATIYAYGAPTSCVRCVITSSRLYTTPSVTLRRHKAAAASSSSFARALNYEYADGVDYRGLTAFASLSMAVSERILWLSVLGLIFAVAVSSYMANPLNNIVSNWITPLLVLSQVQRCLFSLPR
ncbi:hypothetical protein [Candidatus Reidiella endopervernicosa]|uniref:hypothetical protein n=1 Tax=Candidatus Reidiella endopervernicosa TaxID=2738883 RepID=UPI001F38FB3B|nr:hypothetical protein [Candidatus Reidiella endopervernicosa]